MRRIALIGLSLVLALGAIGAAYAAWTDQVTITETISTGEVLVGILDVGTDDSGPAGVPGDPGSYFVGSLDPGWQQGAPVIYDKNVARCESVNLRPVLDADGNDTGFYAEVLETIENAYPSYAPTVKIRIANLGTIPVILSHIVQEPVTDPDGLAPFVELVKWEAYNSAGIMMSGAGWVELNGWLGSGILQIEPGDFVELWLTKHILQDVGSDVCPEGATVTMTETLHFVQWNEPHPDK